MGGRALILDSAKFPACWQIQLHVAPGELPYYLINTAEGDCIHSDQLAGAWWRRPNDHEIPSGVTDKQHRRFCRAESRALLEGWAYGLGRRLINPLEKEFAARRKPYQLEVASRIGLVTPTTNVTNDPSAVAEMAAAGHPCIYKILTNTPWQFTETRPLGDAEMQNLDSLQTAPVIFQTRIDGGPDVRVTIVDDEVFAVELRASHPEAWLDWRLDMAVDVRPHDLPPDISQRLVNYQRALGLRYGALDLRLDESGQYVFFEVNPGGQYLFAEIHGDAPISRRLAEALLQGPPPPQSHASQYSATEIPAKK
jgi:MvdD pre-ATP grasp domain